MGNPSYRFYALYDKLCRGCSGRGVAEIRTPGLLSGESKRSGLYVATAPLLDSTTPGSSDCVIPWSPGVRTNKAYPRGDMVREDESAGGQMISRMGRQSGKYAGWKPAGLAIVIPGYCG